MNRKCPNCRLVNYADARVCVRCGAETRETENITPKGGFIKTAVLRRACVCFAVCIAALAAFYGSLLFSASGLTSEQRSAVAAAIELLQAKGFADEVFYLRNLAVFRSSDNWLNSSVAKENAFAATNFPFEIVTIYPDFFTYPADATERAAILLHEARHLAGNDEKEAYEFVWKNRKQLGWTSEAYRRSPIWREVRKQTKEYSPNLFVCDFNTYGDCTGQKGKPQKSKRAERPIFVSAEALLSPFQAGFPRRSPSSKYRLAKTLPFGFRPEAASAYRDRPWHSRSS